MPLYEGSQELVYMTHIVNPHNFFVQRVSDQKLAKELLSEYRNADSMPKPSLGYVAEGKIYLAYNKADNLWQRSYVLRLDNSNTEHPKFIVYFFDFGIVETVSIDNLRMLPPEKCYTPPPLALNCSLANCEPINGEWRGDDAILIQDIIDNKRAVIHIHRIIEIDGGGFKVDCDVTTFEDKLSLAHVLVFHGRAKMPNPKYPFINIIGEKPKIFTGNNDFQPKSVNEVKITHIVNPGEFFIRIIQHQRAFDKLTEDINLEYSSGTDAGKIFLPVIGMACVVNTEKCQHLINTLNGSILDEDFTWARCVVTEIGLHGRVRVQLVDYGSYLSVYWSMLRVIQPRFTTLRALATECHLAGITPRNNEWSPASVALLKKYHYHTLELKVKDNRDRGSIGVTLSDKSDEENIVCINNEMVKYKFAITLGVFSFNWNQDLKDQIYMYKSPFDEPIQTKKDKNKIRKKKDSSKQTKNKVEKDDKNKIRKKKDSSKQTKNKVEEDEQNKIRKKKDSSKQTKNKVDEDTKDKGPLRLEAKVVHYISPSIIYVSLEHQYQMFKGMFGNMQRYYRNHKSSGKTEWQVNDKCCTRDIESATWRRATILELAGENAKVVYYDFAIIETVPISNLKELAPEFASIGVAAIKCHLCGVTPAMGDKWPSITKEFLKEQLDAYRSVFITTLGNLKENSMPIEIWVYHTIHGGALEPDIREWRCLNKKIIEQGLGIPIKSEQSAIENDEETLKFLNVTGSVREWLQLEPMLTKPKTKSASGSSRAVEYEDCTEPEIIDFKTPNSIFASEWLPAVPFKSNEFTGLPTFVDNDGVIYLHDVAQEGTFDLIRNSLNARYHDPDPKAKYMKWTIGEPCVALYYYDNSFYRGIVVEVNKETSNCLVRYIDYGNVEVCSFANMRKSIGLHRIPTQAHKCIFNRIQPAGTQWETRTLDYVHKLIVEKHCFVKVSGQAADGVTVIDMKYDKLWINDHLVHLDLAKYKDGSRALDRNFAASTSDTSEYTHNVASAVDFDVGPDYIVKDVEPESILDVEPKLNSDKSTNADNIAGNLGKDIKYPKHSDDEFKCNITIINDSKIFPLSIIHNRELILFYEDMFRDIQESGEGMPPLNGVFANKACIALFAEDKKWHRAMIMEYSAVQERVKVRYVDYGNIELISLADTREIHEEWVRLPPLTVAAKLHGVDINPEIDVGIIAKEFSEVLFGKGPFDAKIINNGEFIPTVELRDANNELVSDKLVEKRVFLKMETKKGEGD